MKKLLSTLFALILAFNCINYCFSTEVEQIAPGDIDGDGVINAIDKVCIAKVIRGMDSLEDYAGDCDLNGDGKYNALDKVTVSKLIRGIAIEDIELYYRYMPIDIFESFILEPEEYVGTWTTKFLVENNTLYRYRISEGEEIISEINEDGYRLAAYYLFTAESVRDDGSKIAVSKYLRSKGLIGTGLVDRITWFASPFVGPSLYVTKGDEAFVIKTGSLTPYGEAYTYEEYYSLYCEIDNVTIDALGNKVESDLAKIHGEYADVPFTVAMEALGAELAWQDQTTLNFTWQGNSYIFDTVTHDVYKNGEWYTDFSALPGGDMYYERLDGEVVMDDVTLWTFLDLEGYRVSFDRSEATIYITEADK